MKFSIKKLRKAFGATKTIDASQADAYTEAIVNDVEGAAFAISETNVMYAGLSELAGYHYFKTIIIGTFRIKTFKGAKLIVNGTDFKLELKSDMLELESEFSKVSNRNVTQIDFEIDSDAVSKISKTNIESMELRVKKDHVQFSIIEDDHDEGLTSKVLTDKNGEQEEE